MIYYAQVEYIKKKKNPKNKNILQLNILSTISGG